MPSNQVTSTPETQQANLERGGRLLARAMEAAPDAPDAIDALIILFSDASWVLRSSTTRTYKAQMSAILRQQVQTGELDNSRVEAGLGRLDLLLKARRGNPPPRTSAKKCKCGSYLEYRLLLQDFVARTQSGKADGIDWVLGLLLRVGPYLGLRTIEWLNASVSAEYLIVQNAKHSNGRANGPARRISVGEVPQPIVAVLGDLIAGLRALTAEKANWGLVLRVLGERLARVCQRLKITRWSLSSLRDVAQATWKRAGMRAAEIAALSGHRSKATSRRYYAGSRHGWPATFACAHPDTTLVAIIEVARPGAPILASSTRVFSEELTSETTTIVGSGLR
jgi:hypothetical protein